MKKAFPSFAVRRLASGPRPKPAQRSPRAAPAHLASAQPSALAPSPARRARRRATPPTASGRSRRVATMRRRRPPRGSHGLTLHPRARLHLPKPVRSLAHSRAASPLRQSRAPAALPLAAPRTRRRNSPRLPHLGWQSRARSSASPSFKLCSHLRRLPSSGRAASVSPPTAMAPPCSAAMEVAFLLFSSPA